MRRSEALAPLSRDHHHALVIARDLARATPEDAAAVARRFVEFLKRHELAHFALEESILLPAVGEQEPGPALAQRVRADHSFLREAMRALADGDQAPGAERLHRVGARLREHVQMEERELFPHLERRLDDPALEAVGTRLRAGSGEG